jgi:hypothetical protein
MLKNYVSFCHDCNTSLPGRSEDLDVIYKIILKEISFDVRRIHCREPDLCGSGQDSVAGSC